MPITHGIRLLFATNTRIRCICASNLLNPSNNAVGRIHSLKQFKPKKFYRPFKKNTARSKDKDPKVYMRNTIDSIVRILRFSTWDSAQEQLQKLQIKWDSFTINQVLKTHPPMEKAWLFFNWASRLGGFKHDQFTYTTMLDIFGEAGRISSMKYVFEQMKEKGLRIDVVTYTSLLNWISKDGDVEGAIEMWEEMKEKGCNPTVVSYTAFMKVLFDSNRPKEAAKVYKEMLEMGCSPNCHTYTVLIEYLAGAGECFFLPPLRIRSYCVFFDIMLHFLMCIVWLLNGIFLFLLESTRLKTWNGGYWNHGTSLGCHGWWG